MQVQHVDHPLVKHHVSALRDVDTKPEQFRILTERLATLVAYEATKDLPLEPCRVTTPLTETDGHRLAGRVGIVPILRAGLGMVPPVLELIPSAEVWHLGFYRDEETLEAVPYYEKLHRAPVDVALITDPMLATGGSAIAALDRVHNWGCRRVKLLCLIAAPEGIAAVHDKYPDTQIYVCSIDEKLNDKAYIVPGLGDAGDRIFNTQHL